MAILIPNVNNNNILITRVNNATVDHCNSQHNITDGTDVPRSSASRRHFACTWYSKLAPPGMSKMQLANKKTSERVCRK